MNGVVEFFNNVKGWGLIKGEGGQIFFIHHKDIVDERFFPKNKPDKFRTLKDGQLVEFSVSTDFNKKHPPAKNLRISVSKTTDTITITEPED